LQAKSSRRWKLAWSAWSAWLIEAGSDLRRMVLVEG
jgi:hypothetical protein